MSHTLSPPERRIERPEDQEGLERLINEVRTLNNRLRMWALPITGGDPIMTRLVLPTTGTFLDFQLHCNGRCLTLNLEGARKTPPKSSQAGSLR